MGSGCNSSSANFFRKNIPDTQVQYTGPAIPALGICPNDLLSEVEAVLLQKIIDYSTGVGINISSIDLTTCAAFSSCLTCCGTCTDLPCLLNCYKNAICSIYGDVQDITTIINSLNNGPYDTKCLTLGANPTLGQIIQELITEFCNLVSAVNTLDTTVTGFTTGINTTIGNFLSTVFSSTCQQGQTGMRMTGSGATLAIQFTGFVPVGAIIPYAGSMSFFDSTGLGYSPGPLCGWAIANGNNGTANMTGLVPLGCSNMGTVPSAITTTPPSSIGFNQVNGEYTHLLTGGESGTGSHTHGVTDPGHSHVMSVNLDSSANSSAVSNFMKIDASSFTTTPDGAADVGNIHAKIRNNTTGITVASNTPTNATKEHNNMQPYRALYYIQRIA